MFCSSYDAVEGVVSTDKLREANFQGQATVGYLYHQAGPRKFAADLWGQASNPSRAFHLAHDTLLDAISSHDLLKEPQFSLAAIWNISSKIGEAFFRSSSSHLHARKWDYDGGPCLPQFRLLMRDGTLLS